MPLPALVRSASFAMELKSAVNELMLRSDGTLALGLGVAVPPPPHAVTNRPAANRAGAKRASFMRTYLSDQSSRCLLPDLAFGARVRRQRVLLRPYGHKGIVLPSRNGVKLDESQFSCMLGVLIIVS